MTDLSTLASGEQRSGWMAALRPVGKASAQFAAERRALVLAHPDLAARLTQPPVGLARPEQWTGYVPPRFDSPDGAGVVRRNDSPVRAALQAIWQEAVSRGEPASGEEP